MQDIIQYVLWYIGIMLIIGVHEFGHFIIGKAMKFKCSEFYIGIGPSLFKKELNGTKFAVKAIPFGGSCTFDDFVKEHEKGENVRGYYLKKALILIAGPVFNLTLALLLTLCMNNVEGLKITAVNDAQLSSVSISEGDIIRNINDVRIYSEKDIEELLVAGTDNTITFLNSDYEKETVGFHCESTTLDITYDNSFGNKIMGAFRNFGKFIEIGTNMYSQMFGSDSGMIEESDFSNPYANLDNGAEVPFSFSRVYNGAVMITSIISLCLGLMNLLPIIVFDGFKLILSLVCAAINRPLSKTANIVAAVIGVILTVIIIV